MIKIGNNDISKIYLGSTEIEKIYQGSTVIYSGGSEPPTPPSPTDYSKQYFTIRALEYDGFVAFNGNDIEYSLDSGSTWNTLQSGGDISIMLDEPVMFKASGLTPTTNGIGSFVFYSPIEVEGNVMSLVNGDDFESATTVSNNQFAYLLSDQYGYLMNAENLILPATTLGTRCYNSMFRGCVNMTTAPVLPATTLVTGCYQYMFASCTNLNSVTCLATDRSANGCTANWLSGVAANGTFTKKAGVTWPSGASGIPNGWTVEEV